MKQYQAGDTILIGVTHSTYNYATSTWTVGDPDVGFPKVTLKDPSGVVKVDAVSMTKLATGKFQHLYILPATPTGTWKGYVEMENGAYPDKQHFSFVVKG